MRKKALKIFIKHDLANDGIVDRSEFGNIVKEYATANRLPIPSEQQITSWMAVYNKNGDGGLSWAEFWNLASDYAEEVKTEEAAQVTFTKFDVSGNGKVNTAEFKKLLADYCTNNSIPMMTDQQITYYMNEFGATAGGELTFTMFWNLVLNWTTHSKTLLAGADIFARFDAGGSGFLDATGFAGAVQAFANEKGLGKIPQSQIDAWMSQYNVDGDTKISADEFKQLILWYVSQIKMQERVMKVFVQHDASRNGLINAAELGKLMKDFASRYGYTHPSDKELVNLMIQYNADGDKELSFGEFYNLASNYAKQDGVQKKTEAIFTKYYPNGAGSINAQSFIKLALEYFKNAGLQAPSQEDMNRWFLKFGANGKLDYTQFQNLAAAYTERAELEVDIKAEFPKYDESGDGKLDNIEFTVLVQDFFKLKGLKEPCEADIKKWMDSYSVGGFLDLSAFTKLAVDWTAQQKLKGNTQAFFNKFEFTSNGSVPRGNVAAAILGWANAQGIKAPSTQQINNYISTYVTDDTVDINFDVFYNIIGAINQGQKDTLEAQLTFNKFDVGGTGAVDAAQFGKLIIDFASSNGLRVPTEAEIANYYKNFVANGQVGMSFSIFQNVVKDFTTQVDLEDTARKTFNKFDVSNNGSVNLVEFGALVKDFTKQNGLDSPSSAQIKAWLKEYDTGKDGEINFDEFMVLVHDYMDEAKLKKDGLSFFTKFPSVVDGKIDVTKFGDFIGQWTASVGLPSLTPAQIQAYISKFNVEGADSINFDVFFNLAKDYKAQLEIKDQAKLTFNKFSGGAKGLSILQFGNLLKEFTKDKLLPTPTAAEISALM